MQMMTPLLHFLQDCCSSCNRILAVAVADDDKISSFSNGGRSRALTWLELQAVLKEC